MKYDKVKYNEKIAYEVKVDESQFRKNRYTAFMEMYPDIPIAIVTVDKKVEMIAECPVYNVLEI